MRKIILFTLILLMTIGINAQIKTPKASTSQKINQTVGLTDIALEYSRPSMKGRVIFGNLVPYKKIWRTGANANTIITFSEAVTIGGTKVKAGTYAIFTKPNVESWEVYFYSDATNWGSPEEWDKTKIVATVKAKVLAMPMKIETFTITFDDITNDSTNLGLLWENVYVAIPIKVPTDTTVSGNIEKVMNGPSAGDYYTAAVYYLNTNKDIYKAKNWIDKAVEMNEKPAFWYYRQQSLIYAKSGDKEGAIKAAQTSLKLATDAKNDDYIKMNNEAIKEWKSK